MIAMQAHLLASSEDLPQAHLEQFLCSTHKAAESIHQVVWIFHEPCWRLNSQSAGSVVEEVLADARFVALCK